ncbi:MAG: multicopper oxidase domain-containing protein [Actinomycetales bacterium]|nr:multicopper oxidase domain-containing protein [Actinomycetales bacterium]
MTKTTPLPPVRATSSTARGRALTALAAAGALLLGGCASDTSADAGAGTVVSAAASTSVEEAVSHSGQVSVTLTAAETQLSYDGVTRWAMTYNGQATGPTIRVHPGDTMTITVVNHLSKPTSLHTHGLHVSPDQDNVFLTVEPGQSRTYRYDIPMDQQAGTYWYHPHVHHLTAEQVASGLSGAIIVEDATDTSLARTTTDRVLVINDPPLTRSNPWTADEATTSGMGSMMGGDAMMGNGSGVDMMTAMLGRSGPRLLTNGRDGVALTDSGGTLERVHVVNATASSQLRLAYDGARMLRLSTTGGRLPTPEEVSSVDLAPGERTELVLVPGSNGGALTAQRLSNEGSGGVVTNPELIATVAADAGTNVSALPRTMKADSRDLFASDATVARTRTITLDGHMNPTIDGVPFDPNTVNLEAKLGTVEEWTIVSNSPMAHPIHLHTWPFQIQGQQGWTDMVTVPAYGTHVIRVVFDDFAGTTVLHCHILDHEDTGMMNVIRVVA